MSAPDFLEDVLTQHERLPHRAHQLVGVRALTTPTDPAKGRTAPRAFGLFDEVGAGKTKQVIDAAQVLFGQGQIDTVVVIAPGFARSTWADPDPTLGEVAKHAWAAVNNVVQEYHGKDPDIDFDPPDALHWIVSNYEYVRRDERRNALIALLKKRKVWLVLDESWAVKGFSDQMRACRMIRARRARWVTLLNGTPLADGKPTDLYYQFAILDPDIIGAKTRAHFKATYCVLGGPANRTTVGYQRLDELNARIAPYVLSRRTRDCFDLPPMLPPVTIEAPLSPANWALYRQMRDNAVAWLGQQASVSRQAIVVALRLAQLTSGYLGGLENLEDEDPDEGAPTVAVPAVDPNIPSWMQKRFPAMPVQSSLPGVLPKPVTSGGVTTQEVGREKLDALLHWLAHHPRPKKLLVWCRFRLELERTVKALQAFYPTVLTLQGGQSKEDRDAAKHLLAPGGDPTPGCVVGNPKAGGASLNFAAASMAVYLSNGPALIERTQSIGRIERPGASSPMTLVDVIATGPKGQKTFDHQVLKALRSKDDLARWTVEEWRRLLRDE